MQPPTTQLDGRVVVVTGGARGMGRAFVRGALAAGARVVATDKSWVGADDFQAEVAASGRALVLDMDVTDDRQIDAALDRTLADFGTADVLINNAALLQMFLFPPTGRVTTLETTDEDWFKSFGVNVFGALKVTRRFVRPMLEQRQGSIINIVSSGILAFSTGGGYHALRPGSREMPYMASKAALATMSFYLADELKPHNVAVNTIIPGHTRGSWFDDTIRARVAAGHAPGRRPVRPEHMVPLALFLASQDASGVTGTMFDVMEWNSQHGFGGYETWFDTSLPEDLQRVFAAAEAEADSG
jgi:NAD(P)-dependent dehydrogenase (short-subunit alcohol dehydrogenase family)